MDDIIILKNISRLVCSFYQYKKSLSITDAISKAIDTLSKTSIVTHSVIGDKFILYTLSPSKFSDDELFQYVRMNIKSLHSVDLEIALFNIDGIRDGMTNDYQYTVPFLEKIINNAKETLEKLLLVEGTYTVNEEDSNVRIIYDHDIDIGAEDIAIEKNVEKQLPGSWTPGWWYDETC